MTQDTKILFEDESLLVIDKPSGVTVNRSDTTDAEETLQNFVEKYLHLEKPTHIPLSADGFRDAFVERSGIVHRLDKETSGVLIIAKNPVAFTKLQLDFKERKVTKRYITLVHGKIQPEIGEIHLPIGRQEWNRKRFGVVAGGKDALTTYKVTNFIQMEETKEILSLLSVEPKTGRTHQIRVHLKYLNHPVFADFLYAGRKTAREDRKYLSRVFLHAESIAFSHPLSGEVVEIRSTLREELRAFLETYTKPLS